MKIGSWFLALGLPLTGVGGAFLPWIWRSSVALQLTAPGLAEFVKFLPEVRTDQIQIERLFFLLPLFLAMLALPLFVVNRDLVLPIWVRLGLRLAVIPLALASLSPVWTPGILISPEFRLQTLLAILSVGLTSIASVLKRLALRPLAVLLVASCLAAITLPSWQFALVQTSIAEAYHEPIYLGWGWWLTVIGLVLATIGSILAAFIRT
jgi:hypothetical protein